METAHKSTNFGQFLRSLRIERNFSNISQYLQHYQVTTISAAYYRDLESGRKQISFDTASELCKSLEADSKRFYYHLLSDVLPNDVMKILVRPIMDETFKDVEERLKKLEDDRQTYRTAFEKSWLAEVMVPTEEIVTYLNEHFELMPIVHFLFNTESTNEFELAEVISRNDLKISVESVMESLATLGLIIVSPAESGSAQFKIRRRLTQLQMPSRHITASNVTQDVGRTYRQLFVPHEIQKCFAPTLPMLKEPLVEHGTYLYSGISATTKENQEKIWLRTRDLIAQIHAVAEPISKGGRPYYFCLGFSSRPEYGPAR